MLIRSAIQEAFPFPNDIDPSRACLYFPPVSTLCPYNRCRPPSVVVPLKLEILPYWRQGRNFVLFDISDYDRPQFRLDFSEVMWVRSNARTHHYRPQFDVSIPLFPKRRYDTEGDLRIVRKRKYFLTFKGQCSSPIRQKAKKALHSIEKKQLIWVRCVDAPDCTNDRECKHRESDYFSAQYSDLLLHSEFSLVLAGQGQHSYRLIEVLSSGAIPVIISDNFVLPFAEDINWKDFAVLFPENGDLNALEVALRKLSTEERDRKRRKAREIYDAYFRTDDLIVSARS